MKFLLSICGALLPLFLYGGIDSLPPRPELFASIDSFYNSKTKAEVSEFQAPEALAWMKYVPSVGVTYTLDGKPRPSASWSTNIIYNARKDKDLRLAKIKSIGQVNELAKYADLEKLRTLLRKYDFLIEDIQFARDLIELDKELFELTKKKFEAAEIDSSTWLRAKKDMKLKEYQLFTRDRELIELESEILIIAKWSISG
ncbi:MAG: hypothetical protein AAF731_07700 [Bacteroidota bacterium]